LQPVPNSAGFIRCYDEVRDCPDVSAWAHLKFGGDNAASLAAAAASVPAAAEFIRRLTSRNLFQTGLAS
jgi:hypothetical protein